MRTRKESTIIFILNLPPIHHAYAVYHHFIHCLAIIATVLSRLIDLQQAGSDTLKREVAFDDLMVNTIKLGFDLRGARRERERERVRVSESEREKEI